MNEQAANGDLNLFVMGGPLSFQSALATAEHHIEQYKGELNTLLERGDWTPDERNDIATRLNNLLLLREQLRAVLLDAQTPRMGFIKINPVEELVKGIAVVSGAAGLQQAAEKIREEQQIQCRLCFDEFGSKSCLRPAHKPRIARVDRRLGPIPETDPQLKQLLEDAKADIPEPRDLMDNL